ncbi:glycosyltransferase family 4 protein [Marinoscillum pacificum]|uniref:glycosyltransferase family 4 protein n=1 Tax=Marinoscillum pacificum TaxID=392723 RepID=UPI0021589BE4|nr:glycosyltransferase family 4 protein [Marinoscillum pacificum]
MRILILAKDYPPTVGGVENYSKNLAEGLSNYKQVKVLTFASKQPLNFKDNVEVVRVKPWSNLEFVMAIQLLGYLIKLTINWRPNLIFATTWKVAIPAYLIKKFGRIDYVITAHGAEITRHRSNRFIMLLMRGILRSAEKIICVSEFTKSRVINYCPSIDTNRVFVVHNGINFESIKRYETNEARNRLSLDQDKIYFLTISRIDNRKGHDVVIESLTELGKLFGNNFEYLIVGDGPCRSQLEERVKALKVNHLVQFTGFVDFELLDYYYSSCDLFVLLNKMESEEDFEGFGLVFAEAGYHGKPVIAGKNGGPLEVVKDGVTGYLVDPTVKSFKEIINKKALDQGQLAKLGNNGMQRVKENFDLELMVAQINDLIE